MFDPMIHRLFALSVGAVLLGLAITAEARAQGPTPETGATLFPGGAYVSYNSIITQRSLSGPVGASLPATARPMFSHEIPFVFTWGVRRDFQLTARFPIVTTRFSAPGLPGEVGGTGLGDAVVFVKYRFVRLDSERGTTQASFSIGPKLPTGRTNLRDAAGNLLPAGLQPGSGATDMFMNLSATYTGLFDIKLLVADESITFFKRFRGTQQTQLGDAFESRFWLSYRPYQSPSVNKEWFIGPALIWQHLGRDRIAGVRQDKSGGDVLALALTTYVGLRAGMTAWFSAEFPVAQTNNGGPVEMNRRFSFGLTQQFRLHR